LEQEITGSALRTSDVDIAGFQRWVDDVASCEPDVDHVRNVLLRTIIKMSGADGAALFEIDRGEIVCPIGIGKCAPLQRFRLPRADTVIGSMTTAHAPVVVDVTEAAGRDVEHCRNVGLMTMLLVPLRRGRNTTGVILAAFEDSSARVDHIDELLQSVVQVGAARLEHLVTAAEREADERLLAAVAEAGRAVLTSDDPKQTLCDRARRLTGAAYASFVEPVSKDELVVVAQSGAQLPAMRLHLDEPSLVGSAFLSGRAQIIHDYKRHPEVLARVVALISDAGLAEPGSAAYLPVRTGESTLGVICLLLDEPFVLRTMTILGLVGMLAAEAALAIDRDRLGRELERQASTDALTGVANRRTFAAHLSRELARINRSGGTVSLVLVDLDYFKDYNDEHGHLGGDMLLRTATSQWLKEMREVDLLARLGGDEFAVVLPDSTAEDAVVLCRRMLDSVPGAVTASAGIAQWDGHEDQPSLYRRCDEALYAAKNSGRGRAHIAS